MKKKMIRFAMVLWLFLVSAQNLFAQVQIERSTEIVKVGQEMYYMHHVKHGETLYGLSKTYNVTVEEIIARNPEIEDGLQVDMVIGIPLRDKNAQGSLKGVSANSVWPKHIVLKGETLYSISRQYGISVDDIVGLNPGVENGLREGQSLILPSSKAEKQENLPDSIYVVKNGENIYSVAKKFRMDIAALKQSNSGLREKLRVGQKIKIPSIENDDPYLVHLVEKSQKTTSLLNKWSVSETEFRNLNPAVGVRVFAGQNVLIPLTPKKQNATHVKHPAIEKPIEPAGIEDTVVGEQEIQLQDTESTFLECFGSKENADKFYNVVLLIPLYLEEVEDISINPDLVETVRKSRPFSFLQYYEGFMLAVDSLTKCNGLKLVLSVYDVDENVSKARKAIDGMRNQRVDLIIGPFFSKAFDEVEQYAKERDIPVVNPFSTRESIIAQNANVIKIKPGAASQTELVGNLIKNYFPDSKVSLFTINSAVARKVSENLYHVLKNAAAPEVKISNATFVEFIKSESRRKKMGKKILSSVEVENRMFSTELLKSRLNDSTLFQNPVFRYSYTADSLRHFKKELSSLRNNVVVAYGNNVVFATEMLNNLNKSVGHFPITLIGLPKWAEFEKLFVDNLLKMNAIYFDDYFVNYHDLNIKQFILSFRKAYDVEPHQYAFEGFDVAWYFLNALQQFGTDFMQCLPSYHIPLLHTQFYFKQNNNSLGLENQFWNVYQYDNRLIELAPLDPIYYLKEY
jgi:ABC-type branched-chain amino acid transport systems, periplasmic component